ncbi:hypothetical protein [Mycolicibacterium septicum]|uniref:hypothetical protein n=1 Tax=Mycolicibacterium septicum TaxID=98668 RepID=UPI00235E9C6B|nr:hypothetical protein [Mycolicibacterium septicum]
MDPISTVGAAASVVAAAGVVWERWHWLRTRPRADLTVVPAAEKSGEKASPALRILGPTTPRGRVMVLINWGNEQAIGIGLKGVHCEVGPAWPSQPGISELAARSEVQFAVDIEAENVERAWLLVIWSSPSGLRTRIRTAWFPVLADGELARVRLRQLHWRSLPKRALLRLAVGPQPSPVTAAFGTGKSAPSIGVPLADPPPTPAWWRQHLLRRLTASDSAIAEAAMSLP